MSPFGVGSLEEFLGGKVSVLAAFSFLSIDKAETFNDGSHAFSDGVAVVTALIILDFWMFWEFGKGVLEFWNLVHNLVDNWNNSG